MHRFEVDIGRRDRANQGAIVRLVCESGGIPSAVIGRIAMDDNTSCFEVQEQVADQVLDGLQAGDRGAAILDALRLAVNQLATQPPACRRAILLLSETADHGSQVSLDEALRALSRTNTAIYALAFSSARSD